MVDSEKSFKSLSADSELQSGYEYLHRGDYKQCKRTIDKKIPKLKSDIDKLNFNILKLLLLTKTKKIKEAKTLINTLKSEVLSKNYNFEVLNYLKNVLIELGEDSTEIDIYKHFFL